MESVSAERNTHALDRVLRYAYTLNWEAIAYVTIFVLAMLTRFVDLGARVMSHDESLHTKFSWDLYKNGNFQHTPLMHGPLLFHMTAFFYVLFGDSDFSARIYPALVGVAVIMMPPLFRRWLGKTGALLTSLLFLASPLLMYYSRYIRHDLPAIFFGMVMAYAIFQYVDGPHRVQRKPYWLVLLAGAMSLLLASKEVGFIYIAIFGSFLTLHWVVQLAQRYLSLRSGRTLFYVIVAGFILGTVASLAMIGVLSIIPYSDYDADNVVNAEDNCVNVANSFQADDNGDGIGNECQFYSGPNLLGRIVTWTLGIFGIAGVTLIGTALWVMRGSTRRFPWMEILIILLIATLICVAFLAVEEATRSEPVTATPVDPNAEDGAVAAAVNSAPIVLAWVVGAAVVGLALAGRAFGFWEELKQFPVFDVLITMGTLILPWLTAIVIYATGASPTDYTPDGIVRAVLSLIPFAAVAVAVGLLWNWRVWLSVTGVFMALFAFFFTTMFTNGQGLASGMVGSLGYWLEQQDVRRGNQPQYYYTLVMVPFYEFLPLIGAAFAGVVGMGELWRFLRGKHESVHSETLDEDLTDSLTRAAEAAAVQEGVVASDGADETLVATANQTVALDGIEVVAVSEKLDRLPFLLFVGYWAALNFFAYTLAGEKMPWLTTHLTIPMGILAGWYGGRLIDRLSGERFRRIGWQMLVFVPLGMVALFRVVDPWLVGEYPFQGTAKIQLDRTMAWLAALFVLAGIAYVLGRIIARIGWNQAWRLAVTGAGIVLLAVTMRSALMASFINYDDATEFLVYAHAGPAHTTIFNALEEISERTTDGMDVRVAYDYKMSWPGSWYFREYPQAVYFDRNPSVQVLDDAAAVVVGSESRGQVEPLLGDRYYHYEYIRMWWPMQDYFNLTAARMDNTFDFSADNATAALTRKGIWDIWWNRDYSTYGRATGGNFELTQWPVADRMHFYVRKDVAAQIWDMGVGAEVISEFDTSLADLWTQRSASLVWGGQESAVSGLLNHPRGVAVGQDGTVYVADSLNHRIQAFDGDGNFLFEWGSFETGANVPGGMFNQPWGIEIGPDGNVYVADTWNHRVQVFTPDGEFIRMWGQLGQLDAAVNPLDFWGPRDVAVAPNGLVYVADTGNKRIRVYTSEGEHMRDIGSGGAGAGQLNEPVGLAIHPDGRLFVADTWNRRIQVFNEFGQYLNSWVVAAWYGDQGNRPYLALDVERGHLYVTDPDAARIIVYDFNGNMLGSFGQPGREDAPLNATQLNVVGGLDIDAEGRAFIADAGASRILRFDPWNEIAVEPLVLPGEQQQEPEATEEVIEEVPGDAGDDVPAVEETEALDS